MILPALATRHRISSYSFRVKGTFSLARTKGTLCKVDPNASHLHDGLLSALGCAQTLCPPDCGADPGRQLVQSEWFGQIVVRPEVQCPDLLFLLVVGRKYDDWSAVPLSQPGQCLNAIHYWHGQVQ